MDLIRCPQSSDDDGLLISSSEYNSLVSGVLKNTIDWVSRKADPTAESLSSLNNKVAVLMSVSPGALGGLCGLVTVRSILSNINGLVLPKQIAVGKATEAFSPDGNLKDEKQRASVEQLGALLAKMIIKLKV